jgi:hypothetical protein
MQIKAYPFIDNPDESKIRRDIEQNPQEFVKNLLTGSRYNFGVENVMSTGCYKEMGYIYYLSPFLRKFVYKQYGEWHEVYAINKTNVRKLIGGVIPQIVEI